MKRRWRLLLCLALLCAPVAHAKDTSADHTPNLSLPDFTREASLQPKDSPVERYDLSVLADLETLSARIKVLNQIEQPDNANKALKEAGVLADEAIALNKAGQGQTAQMGTVLTHLNITLAAFNYAFVLPVPPQLDIFGALGYLTEDMATGTKAASNATLDYKKAPSSSFWSNPGKLSEKDLFKPVKGGPVNLKGVMCNYMGPKTSYGIKGGFEIGCGKQNSKGEYEQNYKLKFGSESRTEPFNSRIYNALGFNVPTVEYTPGVTVKYARDIFKQFQERRSLTTDFSIFGVVIYRQTLGGYLDPFHFIKSAKLANGQEIATAELYQRLFPKADKSQDRPLVDNPSTPPHCDPERYPECNDARYDTEFEKTIISMTTVEGSLEVKDKDLDSLGSWDWNTQAYAELREVRAAGIVSMWVGNYDVRWDNNRVRLVKDGSGKRLGMFVSDIGAGLGNALNPLRVDNDAPMEFAWRFTAGRDERNFYSRGNTTTAEARIGTYGFAIIDFLPVIENKLLKKITRADAAWAAAMIADLSEHQIKAALIAAGFESAEVFLLYQKLQNRREHLLRDTTGSGATLRRSEMYRDYDPKTHGLMMARLPCGNIVEARAQKYVLKELKLVPSDDPQMNLPGKYTGC